MKEPKRSQREFWFVAAAGSGLMLLAGAGAYWIKSNADRPQLRLETAIAENSVLLPASHGLADKAVAELLESLPSDLALEVCISLAGAPARTAKRPCDELREIAAILPAAPPAPPIRSIVAVGAWEIPTPPVGPQLRADAAPTQSAAVPPSPSPIEAPVARPEPAADATAIQTDAAPEPPAADLADTLAAGVQIVSAQTTEPTFPVADDGDLEVTLLPDPAELVVPAIPEDVMAYLLVMSDVPSPGSTDTGDVADSATTDDETTTSAEAAAARAQAAQAKAKAQEQAKARAQARARAKARAKAGAKAIAAALNGDNDTDASNGANVGTGKDRDQGAGAGGGNVGSGGGGKN